MSNNHPGFRALGLSLRPNSSGGIDGDILFMGGTGAPSGATYGGKTLATGQTGIAFREDWASLEDAVYVTKDGGTTWVSWQTLSDLSLAPTSDITVTAGGVATLTGAVHTIRGNAGGADDLDTISGMTDAEVSFLLTGAEAITYRDAAVGGGNISTQRDSSIVTATGDLVMAVLSGSVVRVIPLVIQAGQATASSTAVVTSSKIRLQQTTEPLAAAGTNYVAQYAAGAPLNDAGPFTQFVPSRTAQIVLGAGGAATVVYTIDGTSPRGDAQQEIISTAGGGAGTYQGTLAFATITNIASDFDPLGTTDLQVGVGFGLGEVCTNIDSVGVAGVLEAPVSVDVATGTVIPTTAPNGAVIYTVVYRVQPTITDAGHTHLS